MSETCLTCDDSVPAGPSHSMLPPALNPDFGDPVPTQAAECSASPDVPAACHDGYRVPIMTAQATVPATCQQFLVLAACGARWAYPGLLVEAYPYGHAEVISANGDQITLKNLTMTEGTVIPINTPLRPIPRAPMTEGIFSVAVEDVEDPANAESGALSKNVYVPVGVPVNACGPSAEASRVALRYRKGMCGIPLTTGAEQSQLLLAAWNPVTGCFHFIPTGTEGSQLVIKDGIPKWVSTASNKIVFKFTGGVEAFTVPAGVNQMEIKAWGAGGSNDTGTEAGTSKGGIGGFTRGVFPVTPGDEYVALVGEGQHGLFGRQPYGFAGLAAGALGRGDYAGGGLSGVFTGTTEPVASDAARALVIAGGGGGASHSTIGGLASQGGNGNDPGSSGGESTFQGIAAVLDVHGSGGGGWKGGGYVPTMYAGKGGSGFVHTTGTPNGGAHAVASSSSIEYAARPSLSVPRSTDIDYISGVGRSGQPGLVVVTFSAV